ncbi:MAG TPA: hypothetical protein VE645_09155 [Pseudonocardiaceae bacterium]|nr:hypothetical protein [Pseudonocardiaceae bacterium]
MGDLSREIRALARDVAVLRAELEQYRTELTEVLDRFLEERSCGQAGPVLTSLPEVDGQPGPVRRYRCSTTATRLRR